MKHKVRLTVIDKKLYPELQHQYCADPDSGACPCYNVGDVFEFYRDEDRDVFWHCGLDWAMKTFAEHHINQVDVKVIDGNDAIHFYEKYGFKTKSHILSYSAE